MAEILLSIMVSTLTSHVFSWLTYFAEYQLHLGRRERTYRAGEQVAQPGVELQPGAQLAPGCTLRELRKVLLRQLRVAESAVDGFHGAKIQKIEQNAKEICGIINPKLVFRNELS